MASCARSLGSVFLAHLGPRAQEAGAAPALDEALAVLCAAGRAAWPGMAGDDEVFVAHVAARCPEGEALAAAALPAQRAADLYLCCGCLNGWPGALQAFERAHLSRVPAMLAHLRPSPTLVDEVQQALRQRLLLATDEQPARIGDYAGRGALSLWVRAAAVRTALNQLKAEEVRRRPCQDEDALLRQVAAGRGPGSGESLELAFIKLRDREVVRAAFRDALGELEFDQRNLLRLHYLDGLSLTEIGALQGVHKATISRRMARAEEVLAAAMRCSLGQDLRLPPEEVDSLIALVLSQLDLSLAGLVAGAV